MKKNYLIADKDLDELFKKLWKEKFFILIFTVIFFLLFYFFQSSFVKKLRVQITVNKPPHHFFAEYDKFYKLYFDDKFINVFNSDLRFNLVSNNNLEKFLQKSKDFQNTNFFKKNVNKNNYSENFKLIINDENTYLLIFPEGLNGEALLVDYLVYTYNITLNQSKNKLRLALKNIASIIKSDLEISKKYEYMTSQSSNDVDSFYNSKILSNRIIIVNNLIERLDKEQFNYDAKLFASSKLTGSSISNFYPFLGVVLGFFLAVLTVFFRDKIKHK